MNSKQIESIFTAKVSEYIAKGYTISTTTMSGSQGEVAKVDFRKGNEIIRILLTNETEWDDIGTIRRTSIIVGRNTEPLRKSSQFDTMCSTIWNNRLEVIEQRNFYSVDSSSNYFTEDISEIKAQHDKQLRRYREKDSREQSKKEITSEVAKEIALRFIKRQPKCATKKMKDIKAISRYNASKYDKMHYTVELTNGKSYRIG